MLVNVKLKQYDDAYWAKVRDFLGPNASADELEAYEYLKKVRTGRNTAIPTVTGIYEDAGFNFEHELEERLDYKNSYPALGEMIEFCDKMIGLSSPYGVADSVEQVLEHYKTDLENPDRKFCIAFEVVTKAEQSEQGGWRWHKWGPYIGTFEHQCEYLYDEVGIEQVMVYHIYEIPDNLVAN